MNEKKIDRSGASNLLTDIPDVITLPSVIFVIFFAIGYITDLAFPGDFPAPLMLITVGGVLLLTSICLAGWAIREFIRAKTHVNLHKPALSIVTTGPYRYSRNPMYFALSMLYASAAIALFLVWTLAMLIPCLILLQYGVINREEAYLEAKFGDTYRDYKERVGRWF